MTFAAPFAVATSGFLLGAGLIVAIGAQNAFVLRQGLRRERVAIVVAICVLCDWTLITAGALGFGSLVARFPLVTVIAAWGGAAYLSLHGVWSMRSAFKPESLAADEQERPPLSARVAIAATLAVSLLNPHVYLDTVVLIGSIAAQYDLAMRGWFALGAGFASLVWFSALGFGASLLAPLFRKPIAWRVLDVGIALVMWWIAWTLIAGRLH